MNAEKRQIVAVSQGTAILDYNNLIIPTLEALENIDNVFVVAALGGKGAVLPDAVDVPQNARIADWISFDDLLPLSDVFITNGGYGGVQNSLT